MIPEIAEIPVTRGFSDSVIPSWLSNIDIIRVDDWFRYCDTLAR